MVDPVKYINNYSPIINFEFEAEKLASPVKISTVLDLEEEVIFNFTFHLF